MSKEPGLGDGRENMSNHSAISQTSKLEGTKIKSSQKWNSPIWLGIAGFIGLSSAIGSLQHMIEVFADDIFKVTFIENWIPWLAVLCFALGWYTTHWLEVVLYKNQLGAARVLLLIVLIGAFSISAFFRFFSNHDVLQRFDWAALSLVMSGYCLRSSIFRTESVMQLQKAIFGRQLD